MVEIQHVTRHVHARRPIPTGTLIATHRAESNVWKQETLCRQTRDWMIYEQEKGNLLLVTETTTINSDLVYQDCYGEFDNLLKLYAWVCGMGHADIAQLLVDKFLDSKPRMNFPPN